LSCMGVWSALRCRSTWSALGDLLAQLQRLPKDAELLAMEPGCEQYCERELDEVEWRGGRVYFHLGAWRDGQWSSSRRLGHAPHSSHWPRGGQTGGPAREARSDPRGSTWAGSRSDHEILAGPGRVAPTRRPGSAGLPPDPGGTRLRVPRGEVVPIGTPLAAELGGGWVHSGPGPRHRS
jgi:hypothetical protein